MQGLLAVTELLPGPSFTITSLLTSHPLREEMAERQRKPAHESPFDQMTEQHRLHMVTAEAASYVCSSFITCAAVLSDKFKLHPQLP